jgi:hypothetical protein
MCGFFEDRYPVPGSMYQVSGTGCGIGLQTGRSMREGRIPLVLHPSMPGPDTDNS